MIQKYTVFPLVIMGILILFPVSFAKAAGDQQGIQQLIDKEGKPMIIEVIMELRHGEITIIRGTGFDTHFGRPNKDYISAKSVAEDLKQLNMSVAEFESEIEKYIIKKDKGKKRRMEAHEAITSQRQKDTKDDTGAKEISTPEVSALKEKYNELVLKRQETEDPEEREKLDVEIIAIQNEIVKALEEESKKQEEKASEETNVEETEEEADEDSDSGAGESSEEEVEEQSEE